jgi:hypothetical protein
MKLLNLSKIYYKAVQQKENLINPIERYLADDSNANKALLIKMRYLYNIFNHCLGKMLDIGCGDGYFIRNF